MNSSTKSKQLLPSLPLQCQTLFLTPSYFCHMTFPSFTLKMSLFWNHTHTPSSFLKEQNNIYSEARLKMFKCMCNGSSFCIFMRQKMNVRIFFKFSNSVRNCFLKSLWKLHPMFYAFTYALLKAAKLHL